MIHESAAKGNVELLFARSMWEIVNTWCEARSITWCFFCTGDQQLNDTKHYATLPIAAARAAIVGYTATLYHDAVQREVPSNKRKNKSFLKCITKTPQKPCCSGFQPLWVPDRDGLLDFRNFQSWIEQTFFLPAVISVNKEILHIWLCLK